MRTVVSLTHYTYFQWTVERHHTSCPPPQAAAAADLVLVVGTSANVTPASDIPRVAARAGAKVVEINLEATGENGLF